MDMKITPGALRGRLSALSSKSDVHRAMILAALSNQPTKLFCNTQSADMLATADCLRALSAKISYDEREQAFFVQPISKSAGQEKNKEDKKAETYIEKSGKSFGRKADSRNGQSEDGSEECLLPCSESGSTLRFLLPVAAALGKSCRFTGEGRLPDRPLTELMKVLSEHGIRFSGERLPFSISGKLRGGVFTLPGNVSSQYVTGLLLAFPLLSEEAEIRLTSPLQSKAYVDMTLDTMRRFGVSIEETETGYRCQGRGLCNSSHQSIGLGKMPYESKGVYEADGDWSNAAFWLVADAIGRNRGEKEGVQLSGLREASVQGDKAIVSVIDGLMDGSQKEVDASEIPDLVPALAVFAAYLSGEFRISHGERLRLKECDRLMAVTEGLKRFGCDIEELPDGLLIRGRGGLKGGAAAESYNDHRIAMALSIAGAYAKEPVVIRKAEAVRKSYPDFYRDFQSLGGKTDVICAGT